MSEFDKWYKNSGNAWSFPTYSTNEPKFKVGWRAALEWVLNNREPYYDEDKKVVATDSDIIYKELEE